MCEVFKYFFLSISDMVSALSFWFVPAALSGQQKKMLPAVNGQHKMMLLAVGTVHAPNQQHMMVHSVAVVNKLMGGGSLDLEEQMPTVRLVYTEALIVYTLAGYIQAQIA